MKIAKAFSLIELMVVIAIVAVLAAVAVPAYKDYIVKAKLSNSMSFLRSYVNQESQYYGSHGVYASLQQLGYTGPMDGTGQTPMPNTYNDYALPPQIALFGAGATDTNSYTCAGASVFAIISNFKDGAYTSSDNDHTIAYVFLYAIQQPSGVEIQTCYYSYGNGGSMTPVSGDYIAGCDNQVDHPSAYMDTLALLNAC